MTLYKCTVEKKRYGAQKDKGPKSLFQSCKVPEKLPQRVTLRNCLWIFHTEYCSSKASLTLHKYFTLPYVLWGDKRICLYSDVLLQIERHQLYQMCNLPKNIGMVLSTIIKVLYQFLRNQQMNKIYYGHREYT